MWQLWLIVAGIFFILEMATVGFLIFWFGLGALLALISSLFTDNIIIQTSIFVLSSGLLVFLTRPFVNKFAKTDKVETNAFSIIGKTGLVIKDIDPLNDVGQIKVDGEIWSAKSENEIPIEKGTQIEVCSISGVKAVVAVKEVCSSKN